MELAHLLARVAALPADAVAPAPRPRLVVSPLGAGLTASLAPWPADLVARATAEVSAGWRRMVVRALTEKGPTPCP